MSMQAGGKIGRPSLYDPAFCEVAIKAGDAGKSLAWIAAEIGVDRVTLWRWTDDHEGFCNAITRAKLLSQRWWEDAGQKGMIAPGFNASVWSRSMAARFPDDWREVKGTEHSGPNGGAIQTTTKMLPADVVEKIERESDGAY